jgi:hypothetical protein
MFISAVVVKKSRRNQRCGYCSAFIRQGNSYCDLYGSAGGDPPYHMSLCLDCAVNSGEAKIKSALKKDG